MKVKSESLEAVFSAIEHLKQEVHRVVIGQDRLVDRLLIALIANGHLLLEGVPGIAKTLTVSTFARVCNLDFKRIQFTPDLLPGDILGTLVYRPEVGKFEVRKGPIFANIVLADEINRSPAKVQSALLEAMQERQVTIGDTTYPLAKPYLVLATQNPIEQEGTYPLPEAQIDRFLMKVHLTYPSYEEERLIMRTKASPNPDDQVTPLPSLKWLDVAQTAIEQVQLNERMENYILNIVFATRSPEKYGLPELKSYIRFGASPRATIALHLCARIHALLQNRMVTLPDDVKAIVKDVLNHRLILTYEALVDEVTTETLIEQILNTIEW
jgi:MoxR-like ATPase